MPALRGKAKANFTQASEKSAKKRKNEVKENSSSSSSSESRKMVKLQDFVNEPNGEQSENILETVKIASDINYWSKDHGRVELRKRLKEICNNLARVDSVKNAFDRDVKDDESREDLQKELCIELSKLSRTVCESDILFESKSDDLQVFAACVLVEIFRLIDNPFDIIYSTESSISKENTKKKRRESLNGKNDSLQKVMRFFIEQILAGISESGNQLFPLYFHILEVLSNRASFLLISKVQSSRSQDELYYFAFESFLNLSAKNLLPQVRDFLFNILKDIILEPDAQMENKIFLLLLDRLASSKNVTFEINLNFLIFLE
jgi:hypothetical protein